VSRGGLCLLACALASWVSLASSSVAEVDQKRGVRVSVSAELAPRALPRTGTAPVAISLAGKIKAIAPEGPPQLEKITIEINSHGTLTSRGLPQCRRGKIDPSTTSEALAACRGALVGEGSFSADVKLPEQSPFPSSGKVLAFNARYLGRPAIFAHIYGTEPAPTSYVLPFVINRTGDTYGTVLEASLPRVTGDWGFVTGISMRLSRRFSAGGHRRSYISAGCPAPAGADAAVFPLARTGFAFEGGLKLTSVLIRTCRVDHR